MTHKIAYLIFPDLQLLDAAGPIAAFEVAGRLQPNAYAQRIIAVNPGTIVSSSGLALHATALPRPEAIHTLVVVGGDGSRAAAACPKTLRFVQACAVKCRRVVSICTGAYVLAAAGLLDGKSATTHWSRADDFAKRFPKVRLHAERIFVRQGNLWTSAGVTAGIDLALALIAEDVGEDIARRAAQQLVVYHRRPGGQSQFSALLHMERSDGRFTELLAYIRANLRKPHYVEQLAAQACMSPRHFARAFTAETGVSPAKAVERLRAEAARAALESGKRSIKSVSRSCGFGDAERMRRTFVRLFDAPPSALKRRAETAMRTSQRTRN